MKLRCKIILIISVMITIICSYYFSDNSYKNRLISKIEDATAVVLNNADGDSETLEFKKEINPYVIFLNIIDVDRPWDSFFENDDKVFVDTGIKIEYRKNKQSLGMAKILEDKNNEQRYVIYMRGVYWESEIEKETILKLLK